MSHLKSLFLLIKSHKSKNNFTHSAYLINSLFHLSVINLIVACFFICVLTQNQLRAEETELSTLKESGISWGRKYFFDAPRFKDKNVSDLIDNAIYEKLMTHGIQLTKGDTNSKYVLNYTILLGDTASEREIEDLYKEEPELKELTEDTSNFEQGKFLITIRDRKTNKLTWRNSVEGLANLNMSKEIRLKRVLTIVDEAFSTFPN